MWLLEDEQQPQLASPDGGGHTPTGTATPIGIDHTPRYNTTTPIRVKHTLLDKHQPLFSVDHTQIPTSSTVGHTPSDANISHTLADEQQQFTPGIGGHTPGPLFTSATPKLTDSQLSSSFSHSSKGQASPLLFTSAQHRTVLPSPLVTEQFTTPTQQGVGFLQDVLPPTPFQQAEFDLDSTEDEQLSSQDELAQGATGGTGQQQGSGTMPVLDHVQFPEMARTSSNISSSDSIGAALSSPHLVSFSEGTSAAQLSHISQSPVGGVLSPERNAVDAGSKAAVSPLDTASILALVSPGNATPLTPVTAHTSDQSQLKSDISFSPALGSLVDISTPGKNPSPLAGQMRSIGSTPGRNNMQTPLLTSTAHVHDQAKVPSYLYPGTGSKITTSSMSSQG
jgi:hypothetical protein